LIRSGAETRSFLPAPLARLAALAATTALLACARPPLDDLPQEYTETLGEIGVLAVYPPREDIRIGDVFLRAGARDNLADPSASVRIRIGSIEELHCRARVLAEARLAYAARTGDGQAVAVGQLDLPQSRTGALPAVAFPQTVAAGAGAAAAGGGTLGGLLSVEGAGAERVAMAFGAVRHASADAWTFDGQPTPAYAAPEGGSLAASLEACAGPASARAPGASAALRAYNRTTATFCPSFFGALNVAANAHLRGCQLEGNACDFIVVTDLYLARRIGYGYADAASGGVSLARGEAASVAASVAAPELTATPSAPAAAGAAQAAAEIAAPGAAAQVSTARSFAFAETFPAPVAIGLGAIFIDAETACSPTPATQAAPRNG